MSQNPTPSATLFQTFAVSGQVSEPHGNLARSGPVDQAMFYRWAAATVTYKLVTGGQTYTDTLVALTPARVYGTTRTTVDLRAARYVIFTEPQRGGAATLWIADEGYYNFLAQQGYVIPLDYCWWDGMQFYQGTGGVALPPPGGSILGGASYGALDSHSIQGGGSVSGIATSIGGKLGDPAGRYSLFFRAPAAPTAQTTILDLYTGSAGYIRVSLTPALHVVVEEAVQGYTIATHDLGAITTGANFYWITLWTFCNYDGVQVEFHSQLYGPAGVALGGNSTVIAGNGTPARGFTVVVGLGVTESPSSYANWPNQAGWDLSKFIVDSIPSQQAGPRAPLTADVPNGQGVTAYMMRDGVGPATTLTDTSGNNHPLQAGPQGLTVAVEGPFA
jgi:hypothetical protein